MNTKSLDSTLRERIVRYADALNAPAFDITAVRRRAARGANVHVLRPFKWRLAAGMVLVAALLAVEPGIPAIVSGVSHAFQAFVITDGHVQRATTRIVTLEQARNDMPFRVIAPAGLPNSMHASITEVYTSPNRANAQLWFRYNGPERGMELTILETSPSNPYAPPGAGGRPPSRNGELIYAQSPNGIRTMMMGGATTTGGATITRTPPMTCVSVSIVHKESGPHLSTSCQPPAKPPLGHGQTMRRCTHTKLNGGVGVVCSGGSGPFMTQVTGGRIVTRRGFGGPMRWVAHGTLIVLFDPAGTLSAKQTQALRASMSR